MNKIVKGDPIPVGEREIVPIVRVTKRGRRRADIGTDGISGGGWGRVHMRPVAVLEKGEAGERHLPVPDRASPIFLSMILAGFVIPLLAMIGARFLGRGRS